MKVEIGKRYKRKDTGETCEVVEKLLFNTCIGFKELGTYPTQYIKYKDFSHLFDSLP